MEIEILEEEKTMLKFKIKGETHTLTNLLKKELFNDNSVEFAGFTIEHPLKGEAIFVVKTVRKNPKKALNDAVERIQKQLADFEAQVKIV